MVDYSKNPGEELLHIYTSPGIPIAMAGLNTLDYSIISYDNLQGIDFRNKDNTRMWFQDVNNASATKIEVSSDDSFIVYSDNANNIVMLTS